MQITGEHSGYSVDIDEQVHSGSLKQHDHPEDLVQRQLCKVDHHVQLIGQDQQHPLPTFCTTLYWVLLPMFMLLSEDITFTMTVYMYTPGNMNHYCTNYCTICHVLATINTDDMVHYIRLVVKSSESPESEIFCSVALFLASKTYLKKSKPKTGRIVIVRGSHPPQLQDPLPQQQLLQPHRYQEVPSQPLQCQGHGGQGKFSIKSETVLGHNFIFLRRCFITLRMWSPRAPCPGRTSLRRVPPLTRPTASISCTSSLLTVGSVYRVQQFDLSWSSSTNPHLLGTTSTPKVWFRRLESKYE